MSGLPAELAPVWAASVALMEAGRAAEALPQLARLARAAPEYPPVWNNLGIALRRGGDPAAAEAAIRRGLACPGGDTEAAWSNLGNVLRDQGRFDDAEAAYAAALARGGAPGTRYNAALLQRDRGRVAEALALIRPALAARPDDPAWLWDYALMLLQAGDWRRGFAAYEARWGLKGVVRPDTGRPWWDGGPRRGRTLLVAGEQGMGDVIQFARFLPLVPRDGPLVLAVRKPLVRLLRAAPALAHVAVVEAAAAPPPHDLLLPIMSLPRVLGATPEAMPPPLAFAVPEALLERAAGAFPPRDGRRRTGIVWAGSAGHRNDANRSAGLQAFLPLCADSRRQVWSFQVGPRAADLARPGYAGFLGDLSPAIDDFLDTAAFLRQIDELIAVDTGIVHLAGSLGVPTAVLLPEACDWRWGAGAAATPWYPSLRLARQRRQGDWASALAAATGNA